MAISAPNIITGSSQGALDYEIITAADIYREDIAEKLKAKIPDARPFLWMKKLGADRMVAKKRSNRSVFHHYEDGEWFPATVTIAAKATPVANQVVITLAAADHTNSGKASYPKLTQLAIFDNGAVGYVIAKNVSSDNAHTVTIQRQNASQDVQAAAVVGQKCVFYSNQQEAGSKKKDGYYPEFEKITHKIHTFREDLEAEDHEMMNDLWFEVDGSKKVYVKALDDMANKFVLQEDLGMLLTPDASGVTGVDKGKTIRSTTGMIPRIEAAGINMEYTGNPNQSTFETAELLLDKYYGDSEMLFAMGINAEQSMRKWIIDFAGDDKGIKFSGKDKQSIGIDFKSAQLGAYKFHFQTWRTFSHPGSLGNLSRYRHMMVGIPLGGGNVYTSEDRSESENRKYFRMVYQQVPGTNLSSDDIFKWGTGALNKPATSDELIQGWHMASYKTLEMHCLNKFMIIDKADI